MPLQICLLLLLGGIASVWGNADVAPPTFRYEAYVAGALAGRVWVTVDVNDVGYHISGKARSEGLFALTEWRATFSASGQVHEQGSTPKRYSLTQKDNNKIREVSVVDGELTVYKDGKIRGKGAELARFDILTVLFIAPICSDSLDFHTGRHSYVLTRVGEPSEMCRYSVVDDDGDTYHVALKLVERNGLVVPGVVEVIGFIAGRMELVDNP
ncbi:MAG: DUF3108 domain-containing protein [Proteobacteria bacterium]|nr:DUF3108 domain-containing protein [Pseudomonadota bacterium]